MKQKLLLLIATFFSLFLSGESKAQTLVGGDIAFIGMNTVNSGTDAFSFITLKDLPAGETIYFTDQGWNTNSWPSNAEGHFSWVIPVNGVSCGKIITISYASSTLSIAGASGTLTLVSGTFNLNPAGDQVLAYQSVSGAAPSSPIFLAGLHMNYDSGNLGQAGWSNSVVANNGSDCTIPFPFPVGSPPNPANCVAVYTGGNLGTTGGPEPNFAKFDFTNNALTGTPSQIRAKVNDPTKWIFDNAEFDISPTGYGIPNVTCTAATKPVVTTSAETNLGAFSVTLGGTFTDGGSALTGRGVVWSYTDTTPTVGEPGVTNVTITGTASPFSQSITSLLNNTTIYYSAYASNIIGTTYGDVEFFTTNAALSATQSQVNVACKGGSTGSATVTASGGKPSYSYVWTGSSSTTNTAANLAAGNYSVIISDTEGGSPVQKNFTISEPLTTLSSSLSAQNNVTTYGGSDGSATVNVTGGTTGYTYLWSPSGGTAATASELAAGTYTLTIKDNNGNAPSCTITRNVTITQPVGVAASVSSLSAFTACAGTPSAEQSFTVNGGGGSGLTANLIVSAPTGFEVSKTSGTGFASSINFTPTGGAVAVSTVYVRLSGAAAGSYTGNDITVSSATPGVTTKNVAVTGTVNAIAFTSHPSVSSICTGANTTFSVVASNATGYQWQVNKNDGNGYVNVTNTAPYSNATTATLTITGAAIAMNGYLYRAVASGTCPSATSNSAVLTVSSTLSVTNPANRTICTGFNTTFTVTSAAATTYQWQVSTDGGANYADIANVAPYSNVTTATMTVTGATSAITGNRYRCVVTNACATANSTSGGVLTVITIALAQSQTNVTTYGGANGTATVTPSGGIPTYTYIWSNGTNAATATGLTAGTYTVTVTDALSCAATSANYVITQPAGVLATVSSLSAFSTCSGTASATKNFSVNGDGLTADLVVTAPTGYEVSLSSGSGFGSSVSITPTGGNVHLTTIYVQMAASAVGTMAGNITVASTGVTTKNVAVTGTAALIDFTTQPSSATACIGTNKTFTIVAAGATGYQWWYSTDSGTNFSLISNGAPYSGTTTATLTITNITAGLNGIQYRAVASGTCPSATSNAATLTVPVITVASSTTPVVCFGESNGTATVSPSGGTAPYSYVWSASAGSATTQTVSGLPAGTYSVVVTDNNLCSVTKTGITVNQPTAVSANPTQINVSCNGLSDGSATVAPSGGTTPYTYLWSNADTTASISGLAQGNYSVTITDGNLCQKTESFTISEPTVLASSQGTINNTSCHNGSNGSATVVVTGGTTPYTYDWNGTPTGDGTATISGLAAGTYTVIVKDAHLCETTQSFIISQPTALTATASQTNILCNGSATGAASVTVSGGTGAYTYSWLPSGGTAATASGLVAGTYTVTIRDANFCQITESFTITQPTNTLVATAGTITHVDCRGNLTGGATVNVTGGTGAYTYSWAPSGGTAATASGLASGTYVVTVKDANLCSTTQSFTITQPAAVLSATTASTGVSCFGGSNGSASVNVSGGTPGYTYLWAPLGGTGSSISGRPAGNYTCTITDSKGCTLVKNITISTPAQFTPTVTKTDVSCFGGTNGTGSITVTGGTGPFTYAWAPGGGNAASASGLAAATYTVTVADANTCTYAVTVVIDQPAPLVVTPSKTDVLCNGGATGTASVSVTGGNPGYTYLWSPSGGTAATATGLAIGSYSCLITDTKGCTFTQGFTINQPAVLTATTAQQNATCVNSGQASVTPSGGAGSYTYLWSPSGVTTQLATGLAAGPHSCLITDANGCTLTKNITITTTNTLTATQSHTNALCNGANTGTATVVPAGAPGPFSYVWAPSGGNAATATGLTAGNYSVTITASNGCSIVKNFIITEPAAFVITPSQTNLICNGGTNGSASIAVSGGTGAYTYVWMPSGGTSATVTGLGAGTYTVTVKDANLCHATQTFTITEPSAIAVSAGTHTNVSCNGGSNGQLTAAVTGGTGAYTYAWSPSVSTTATASGLSAGTYTVTVKDANLCQATQTFTITEPNVLSAATTQTDVLCNSAANGTAGVTVSGGTVPYTYVWTPSVSTAATATGLAPGTYSVNVTDVNGCSLTKNFTIAQPIAALTATTTQTNVLCSGASTASATVTVSGGTAGYTYLWSPSGGTAATATGLAGGNYSVLITDANGCTLTKTFTIISTPGITATTAQTNVLCFGASTGSATVEVSSGTPGYTYLWAPSGGTSPIATNLSAGNYTCTITDANGCTLVKSFTITQLPVLVINGSSSNITCNGAANGAASVSVTGGTPGYTYLWAPSGGTSPVATGLSAGNYTCTVTDVNGCTAIRPFTILQQTPIVVTSVKTNLLCHNDTNGSATVTVTGGVPNYSYVWTPSGGFGATATGLTAGTYTVTVSDAQGCSMVHSVTISSPDKLEVDVTQTNISCFQSHNGSVGVDVSGGVGPYTYAWTPSLGTGPSLTGLGVGNYGVTITDANGCIQIRNFSISQPAQLTASITKTDVGCYGGNDGSAFATVTGGTSPYTYEWTSPNGGTPDPANLVSGIYTVTITDANGCTFTGNITISQPLQAVINSQPQDVTINAGGNATFTVNAINANAYQWQVSGDGANWTTITNGGTNPAYSGATTNSLTISGAPSNHNGFLYRIMVMHGADCFITSSEATLNINNTLEAVDDDFSDTVITAGEGGIAGNVTANDLFNDEQVNNDDVIITVTNNDGLFGAVIDNDGNLIVPPTAAQGTYTITYKICDSNDQTNCSTAEIIVVVSEISGTKSFGNINLSISPNPATTEVFIRIPDFSSHNNIKVTIYDLNGRLVKESRITSELQGIDITGLESGVYIFNITSDTGQASKRIIVDKKF